MSLTWDDYLHNLRLSTIEVVNPLVALNVRRLNMIREMVKYIQAQPQTLQQLEILQQYNEFCRDDDHLVEVCKGRVDQEMTRVKKR